MKILEFIKETWKQNKINYFISCGVIAMGSFIILSKNRVPLENLVFVVPAGMFMAITLLYGISFMGGIKE